MLVLMPLILELGGKGNLVYKLQACQGYVDRSWFVCFFKMKGKKGKGQKGCSVDKSVLRAGQTYNLCTPLWEDRESTLNSCTPGGGSIRL